MTETRQAILQTISEQLTAALKSVSGEGDQTPLQSAPASPKAPREIIESKLMPCDRCGNNAAMVIFAYDPKTVADFENFARKMYVKYSDLNVPTWIVGEPIGIPGFGTPLAEQAHHAICEFAMGRGSKTATSLPATTPEPINGLHESVPSLKHS